MGDDTAVRRLIEMLSAFYTEGRAVEEDLTCSLTSEFLWNIRDVLFTKQIVVFSRWQIFFDVGCEEMLSSPEMYLRNVFYACLQDALVNLNIFERFLSAFALILRISVETRHRKGLNFCKLVPDVFMEFYKKELKKPFGRCGGFRRFVEYINNPNYLESKCIGRNLSYSYDPNASVNEIPEDLREKACRMIQEGGDFPRRFNFVEAEMDKNSSSLAKKVLEITRIEFLPLPSEFLPKPSDDNISLYDVIRQKIARIAESLNIPVTFEKVGDSELTSERCPSLNSDSKTNDDAPGQMADNARYENIIEAVIRHNHSKSSCHGKSKGRIQTEADGILEHLRSTIKCLIEVLDEYDKE
ncbi:hypothetical protein AVEN_173410-1 [Araneus ventricosus]|uniref:Uncharacterized protein n=1 Tax=Araneus ventricosus TaxID=182803 RepID=A0A4Y2FNN0_ARAVE|nr:hypothetical protein AVEN_173410-1 [Araneus ventricosus]